MRGRRAKKRKPQPDPRYKSELVTRFTNKIMQHGKRGTAENMFYEAIESASKEQKVDTMEYLTQLVDNIRPALEIKARRVGGANYQVPVPVTPYRQETLAIRWLVDTARNKTGASFPELLRREFVDAFNNTGDVIKKKEETERMAEANKAFAHFRW